MTSHSTGDWLKPQEKMSDTAMITMFGNDIHYAIGELCQSMAAAFTSPPKASTILQQNKEGFPHKIILAAMSFFSDAGNAEKAKMYV